MRKSAGATQSSSRKLAMDWNKGTNGRWLVAYLSIKQIWVRSSVTTGKAHLRKC